MTLQIHRLCCWSHSAWMVSLPSIRTDLNGPFFKCRQKGTLASTAFIHDEVGKFTLSKERKKWERCCYVCICKMVGSTTNIQYLWCISPESFYLEKCPLCPQIYWKTFFFGSGHMKLLVTIPTWGKKVQQRRSKVRFSFPPKPSSCLLRCVPLGAQLSN